MKVLSVLTILFTVFLAGTVTAQTPQTVEDELLAHFKTLNEASNYGGNSDVDVQDRESEAIYDKLRKYGKRTDVLKYSFPRLSDKMSIVTAGDGKYREYSWDCECGGTMHNFYTVVQYLGASGKAHVWAPPLTTDIAESGVGAFTHDIFPLTIGKRRIYITVSTFIGSTSLSGQFIGAVSVDGEKLNHEPHVIRTKTGFTDSIFFEYDFFSVVDHPERPIKLVFFDEAERSFKFPVVVEDEHFMNGKVTDKFITYKFNGKYFEKTK